MKLDTQELVTRFGPALEASSLVIQDDAALWMHHSPRGKQLALVANPTHSWFALFTGESEAFDAEHTFKLCPLTNENAYALQLALPNLRPMPLGLNTSAGCGDRLGLATPGHVPAFETIKREMGQCPAPIFPQQSIREMNRTGRSAQEVMRDATFGAFEGGWKESVGADADHLKTTADIDICVQAGFTFYTIDPGEYVDSAADHATRAELETKIAALHWNELECTRNELTARYVGKTFDLEGHPIALDENAVWRAATKYGNAVAHVTKMYRHLASKGITFELEVSVDETETPTTHAEHIFVVSELTRLGVRWVSLAPRYVGRFEKGVDYIGDLAALEQDLQGHAAIARQFGPYKLSLHSGSDKFSVYPLIVRAARGQVHLKTAGTSYLEALRVIAQVDAEFFRRILKFSRERYPTDRATYHVSAELARVPEPETLRDDELPALLDQFDARQVLHVTFGSVLVEFGDALKQTLGANQARYNRVLETHFVKHLKPFAETRSVMNQS